MEEGNIEATAPLGGGLPGAPGIPASPWLSAGTERHMTAAVMQAQLFDDTDAPWDAMMAAAFIYSLPPVAIFFVLRRTMTAALTRQGR